MARHGDVSTSHTFRRDDPARYMLQLLCRLTTDLFWQCLCYMTVWLLQTVILPAFCAYIHHQMRWHDHHSIKTLVIPPATCTDDEISSNGHDYQDLADTACSHVLALRLPRIVVADCSRASLPWRIMVQNSLKSILPSLSISTSDRILSISLAAC